jgi:DNA processing protein
MDLAMNQPSRQPERILNAVEMSLVPGLGIQTQARIHKLCPDILDAFALPDQILESLGLANDSIQTMRARVYRPAAEEIVDWCGREHCTIIMHGDESYPPALAQIFDPPLVLYCQGNPAALARPSIAIVGTRRPSFYGLQMAEGLARDLSDRNIVIVSGLARGIDAAAHRGCLQGASATIAVLGCGIDIIYPKEHRRLTDQIREKGLLISEFVPGTSPAPQNFPVRNRIISGLSLGTMVAEASEYSGSLITARLAMEQNREVFALPGNLTSPRSFGPNFLIKQGAKLVQSWRDVAEELPSDLRHSILARGNSTGDSHQPELEMLTEEEIKVLHLLESDEAVHFDRVLKRSGLAITRLSEVLLRLEMNGRVRQVPGNLYVRLVRPAK